MLQRHVECSSCSSGQKCQTQDRDVNHACAALELTVELVNLFIGHPIIIWIKEVSIEYENNI